MREILFRGKRKDNGEWIEGYLIKNVEEYGYKGCMTVIIPVDSMIYTRGEGCEFNNYQEVIPETVGQSTGLIDKNGTKIFEGDVLETLDQEHKCLMIVKDVRECRYAALYVGEYRVISNIHDNPEFLEVKKKWLN